MKTLFVVVDNTEKKSPSYTLYFLQDNGKILTPIGFEGLETDYPEIQKFKKWNKANHTFVYKSTCISYYPRDIIHALRDRFDRVQLLTANQSGAAWDTVKNICNSHTDIYSE